MRKFLFSSQVDFERNSDAKQLAESAKKSMELLDPLACRVLKCVLLHMKRMSDVKDNKMDARNMATVFSPNLVHSEETGARRPESIMYEMEWNNMLVEKLIANVNIIF
jgi:hypothetical protein